MGAVLLAGLLTGWAIAVPVGAVAALVVTLSARTSWRVGAAAALGVATVDAGYALIAVLAGATISPLLAPIARPLEIVAGAVLLALAVLTGWRALRPGDPTASQDAPATRLPAWRAYLLLIAVTALNPATVVYFTAIVLGDATLTDGAAQAGVFVAAVAAASASWQLLLATGGVALGRVLTGPRGRVVTGVVSALVIGVLALRTMLAA